MFVATGAGEYAPVTDHIKKLSGRDPMPASKFIAGLVR
jgi:hypothetical protein